MKKDAIAVIGRVAEGTELLDGQTVKTKILLGELERCFPDRKIICVDTYRYKKRMIPILFHTIRSFCSCGHIFVLLSRKGRVFFFPLLTMLDRIFHRRMYHDVIGGALPREVREHPSLCRHLKRFEVNWVEFSGMQQELAQLGIHNVEVLPNFKRLEILRPDQLPCASHPPFLFTMFSRVTKEKGVTAAAEAIAQICRQSGAPIAQLRIYGPVEAPYREEFQQILARYPHCVHYMGCIPQDQSVEALRGSFMLLFPSVYPGEGMPGTIIDAFSAGLPVISTDWHFNAELVRDGETGYHYDWRHPELLAERIGYAIAHPQEVDAMRPACLAEAAKYNAETVMEQILRRMDG